MLAALFSALHLLTLGIGLGAVYARARALHALSEGDAQAIGRVLVADNFWGVAALLWIATGLVRVFGELDKGRDFYVYNGFFWIKMGLFAAVFALEVTPMVAFIRWRIALRKGQVPDTSRAATFARITDAETALVIAIPFVAAAMVRGLWLLG